MFHVLVIDDDEQMQFFLNEALRRQGYASRSGRRPRKASRY